LAFVWRSSSFLRRACLVGSVQALSVLFSKS
jgi:hypothetical protein